MDDNLFGSFQTSKIRTRKAQFDEIGDAMVRELDFSKINLRLKEKEDSRDEKEGHTLAQLSGDTAVVLKQCLNNPSTLSMRGSDGNENKVTISLKYIPIKMNIEARESISNMGTLRVDVVDGKDLPAADRSGFSDPYCKFEMNGKEIYKTQKIKKTLNPTWNENFEVQVPSRTAAKFICKVYDWDFGEKADFLGATVIDLSKLDPFQPSMRSFPLDGKSGAIRLKMLFRPDYVTRSRQGTSSLGSTFHAPSRVATSIVGAPIKGVGKGAAFIKHGFSRNKSGKGGEEGPDVEPMAAGMGVNGDQNLTPTPSTEAPNGSSIGNSDRDTSQTSAAPSVNGMGAVGAVAAAGLPGTPMASHSRIKSFGSRSATGSPDGRPSTSAADHGQASVTILSASGYPPGTKVMVLLKQVIPGKGTKDLHKTKDLKLDKTHEEVRWEHGETVKVGCTPDTQFQVVVKDHKTFGADDVLGEALYLLDESPVAAGPRSLRVGDGTVVLESSFTAAAAALNGDAGSITDSPKNRRSFLRKATPTPAAGSG